ncbi:MAG: PD40 domain-containing protein [Elusimicrobia bacterium]|nr:PD40 domain-containing protein [Elusimicrobiota bacterium]
MRLLLLALSVGLRAHGAEVYIGVAGDAAAGPQWTIGLAAFEAEGNDAEARKLGHQLRSVLRDDLLASRYFRALDPVAGADPADPEPWTRAGAGFLLSARVAQAGSRAALTARLKDLGAGEPVLERYYRQDAKFWRSLAHRVADDIVRQLTGKTGIAHSQLAFVNDQTGSKELYLIDYDGEGLRRLTADGTITLLPRWSPDGKRLAYTSYKRGNPDLIEMNLEKGTSRVLSARQGLNLAGGFSADGRQLVLTLSQQKNPNIYQLDTADLSVKALTSHFGVESSPTFSPDGGQVAFASDRSGNPQIHLLDVATGRIKRLTRMNWCDSPAWSPTGEWILFSGRANAKDPMDIFIVDVTGAHIRQLTHGEGSNEDPAWSPDGRFIAFTSSRGGGRRRRLYVMDADGSAPRLAADIPGRSFTPSWSP